MKKAVITVLTAISAVFVATVSSIGGSSGPLGDRADAVILKGKALPAAMLGAPTANYVVLAQSASGLAPIPFQIDEFNDKGILVAQKGPKAGNDSDKGAFDANDELVFMASDAGGKAASKPTLAGCDSFAEISITDAKTSAAGFAYLAKCSAAPAKSPIKYVGWDDAKRTVTTESYKFGWQADGKFNYYYDYLSLFNGQDILDKLKVYISVSFKGIGLQIKETAMVNDFIGVTVGPVRVNYSNYSVLSMPPIGKVPVFMHIHAYKDWMLINNQIDSAMNPAAWGLDYKVSIIHDLSIDLAKGYKLCTSAIPNCMDINSNVPANVKELTAKEIKWGGVAGPEGTLITRIVMDPRLRTTAQGHYLFDPKANRKPEFFPGSVPEMGFFVINWQDADKALLDLDFYHFVMKKYSVAEIERFDRMNTSPLLVKTSRI